MINLDIDITVIFSEGITMNELNRISWETFTLTGDIDVYLLYKSTTEFETQEDKDDTWQKSGQKALS